jgi:hypothetical protein
MPDEDRVPGRYSRQPSAASLLSNWASKEIKANSSDEARAFRGETIHRVVVSVMEWVDFRA